MYNEIEEVAGMKLRVVEYDNLYEVEKTRREQKYYAGKHAKDTKWAGGTVPEFYKGCLSGDLWYAEQAEKFVNEFSNIAIKDYEATLEWNDQTGELDYEAATAGEEQYMYGPTIEQTDTAPVSIYVDAWTSAMIPTSDMRRRGIAVLALVQALSVYRPVNAYVVAGCRHMPTKSDVLQVCRVPTNPMDLPRAAFMLGSPMFFRQGLLPLVYEHAMTRAQCGVPLLQNGKWQGAEMGEWLAEKEGVHEALLLPYMMGREHQWGSDDAVLEWVKQQMKRYLE